MTPDALGVSSFLGLGWCAGSSTPVKGLEVLAGGARHRIADGQVRTQRYFGPATLRPGSGSARSISDLAGELRALTAEAVRDLDRVGCAITAGRDSRVMTALLEATGTRALYFTGGAEDSADVVIGREIAKLLGLEHEVTHRDPGSDSRDWTRIAGTFMRQGGGLTSLLQLPDYVEMPDPPVPIGVKLWGVGGEIGRAGTGDLNAIATNALGARSSMRVQQWLLARKCRNEAGLMTPAAVEELQRYLHEFARERREEGWAAREIQEAFYTFERVGRWGATGPSRVAVTDDVFSPFCTRAFIEYCFSRPSGERYVEGIHHQLLGELSPALRTHRYESPMRPQWPRLAWAFATRQAARVGVEMVRARLTSAPAADVAKPVLPAYPTQHAWAEQRLDLFRELLPDPGSDLWQFIARERLEALLAGTESDRAGVQEDLLRVFSVLWHFEGPPGQQDGRRRPGVTRAGSGSTR
jgi:asparagine synthase (glutamine-hydrolysing)